MWITEDMGLAEKLNILSDAAKYDVACTSSGTDRRNDGTGMEEEMKEESAPVGRPIRRRTMNGCAISEVLQVSFLLLHFLQVSYISLYVM